jgi:ATP-dependent DNA helicase RecG
MITKLEILSLLKSTESYRVERTVSTANMDKFCEAICAFANDMPGSRRNGYLIIGAHDDGSIAGMTVDDNLLKKISGIRSDGNILPLPTMSVEKFSFPEGDLLVAEVKPSVLPPVRYRGRTFIRVGPRRDIATESEERILTERRCAYVATFDSSPCFRATLDDLDVDYIVSTYLPTLFDSETLASDKRELKDQLAAIHLYDKYNDCPTYAALILFGKNPKYFLLGDYVQFVRFAGETKGGTVLNERQFDGPLCRMLPALESFVRDAIITQRPVPESLFRERTVWNYPESAIRELVMNACMHRDYQSNMPIRLYQFDNYIEVMNAGGLYGEARPENFPKVNDYRNPIVAEAMRVMKYVNKFNRGITRVQEMLGENGNPPASFDVDTLTAFRSVVLSTANSIEKAQESASEKAQEKGEVQEKVQEKVQESASEKAQEKGEVQETVEEPIEDKIVKFCESPRSLTEIIEHCGLKSAHRFRKKYVEPLLGVRIQMTHPETPTHRSQKYKAI